MTDEWMARLLGVQESYTDPETTYRAAKARGMTHVTLTDRDTIQGALRLSGYPDFLMGEEVTAFFPSEALHVDVLVWALARRSTSRSSVIASTSSRWSATSEEEQLAFGLAHPASFQIGGLRAEHFEQLLVLFPLWEVRDGHSDAADNALVGRLLESCADRLPDLSAKYGLATPAQPPRGFGGSDDRSGLDVGTTFTEVSVLGDDLVTALRTRDLTARGERASTPKVAHTGASLFAGSATAGGRVASWTFQRAQRSLMLRELLSSATGRKLVGRALAVGRSRQPAVRLDDLAVPRRCARREQSSAATARIGARLATNGWPPRADAAWQRVLTDNLQRIQDRSGHGRPDGVREILQAQILVAPVSVGGGIQSRAKAARPTRCPRARRWRPAAEAAERAGPHGSRCSPTRTRT